MWHWWQKDSSQFMQLKDLTFFFLPADYSTMGKHFGELAKIRGIVQYRLSPFEQRAFAGAISKGLPNIFFRIRSNIFRVVPREWHFVTLITYWYVNHAFWKILLNTHPQRFSEFLRRPSCCVLTFFLIEVGLAHCGW